MNTYKTREILRTASEISRIESQPLKHKREAKQEFFDRLVTFPDLVAKQISWIFNGDYGYGYQEIGQSYFNRSKRFNIRYRLLGLIALAEFRCPARQARQAYNMLSIRQKDEINKLIEIEVQNHKSNLKTHTTKGE